MQNAGVVKWGRYDWGVDDVRKFDDRVQEHLTRLLGRPLPDVRAWSEVPEEERKAYWERQEADAREEWLEAKQRVLLKALDPMYAEAVPRHEISEKWLKAYDDGRCVNLAIFGVAGVGKTWELAAITRALLLRRVPALMIRVPEMLKRLRPNADGATDLSQFQAAPVLCLDDLGAEQMTEWVAEQMYLLTDYRSRKLLPTIVTSNLGDAALEERYDDRLLRRLFGNAAKLVIREKPQNVAPTRFGVEL